MSHESIHCSLCSIFLIGPCFPCLLGFPWTECLHFFLEFLLQNIWINVLWKIDWLVRFPSCKIVSVIIYKVTPGCSFTCEMLSYAEHLVLEFGTSTCLVLDSALIWFQIAECCDCSRAYKCCHMFKLMQLFKFAVFCICVSFRGFNRSNSYHLSH